MATMVFIPEPVRQRLVETPEGPGQAAAMHFATGQMLVNEAATSEPGQPGQRRAGRIPLYLLEYAAFVLDQRARYCQ
jgi:hypothetical protein